MQFVRIVPGWWEGFFLLPRYQCLVPKCVYSFAINPSVLWAMVVALSAVETQQALLASKPTKAQRRFSMLSTGCRRVNVTATTGHVSLGRASIKKRIERHGAGLKLVPNIDANQIIQTCQAVYMEIVSTP